ncbi:E3 ubiquitin-protein ligase TRIP12-like [Watersipora subatra]|uniref:E3 ubiquitin-protein ligase TRIP12-like n=1 Tax=Watersipora subatra TaxID=2589382 RepID=UPI00355C7756
MDDCSEEVGKPESSKKNLQTKRTKHRSGDQKSGGEVPGLQATSTSADTSCFPAKRRRISRCNKSVDTQTESHPRIGLRSQARTARTDSTRLYNSKGASQNSNTDLTARQPSKGPKAPDKGVSATTTSVGPGSSAAGTSGPTATRVASRTTGQSKRGVSRSKPSIQRDTSTLGSSSKSSKQPLSKSAASTSKAKSDSTFSTSTEAVSSSTGSSHLLTSRRSKLLATRPAATAISKQSKSSGVTAEGSTADSAYQARLSGFRGRTRVATTGEASSRLKRAAAPASSASTRSDQSAAGAAASSSRRRAGGRTSVTNQSGAGSSGASTSGPTAGKGGAEAVPAEMSTSNNANNTAEENNANGSDASSGYQNIASGILNEMLRGADAAGASGGPTAADVDIQRLQAMLEARGLPPHMIGSLESNMRHIIQRSMSSGAMNKVSSLIKGMQAKDDEGQQLTAVMEMCQVLVMGNEENLVGFPAKQVVPELVSLLHMEHNFDMMMYACRALYYMLEALPRSSLVVVEAVPALLDKLKCIQCMDVAEQSLSALDKLSKRHNKNLLQAGAIGACLMYLDFFSIDAQRYALAVAANCCVNITPEEFHYCRASLPLLSSRLLTADKRSVESVCTCFARLVDNLKRDEKLLKELAAHEMLGNTLQLLEVAPPVISSSTFTMVVRMFVLMCSNCPELAVCLLRQSVANTLVYLLCGEQVASKHVELVSRTPQELFEIVSLIGELMPALPTTGPFSVDALLKKHPHHSICDDDATWQWKDDKGTWRPYSAIDNRIIEAAYENAEEEVTISLSDMGRMYTIDFTTNQQINEETGTARNVFRSTDFSSGATAVASSSKPDARAEVLAEQPDLATSFIKSLFGILYEVYSSSAGPAVRHKCLQALLRQIYYASPELLQDVLVNQPVSSHIASMLASHDHKVVVCALQMADILMKRLPDTFSQYFQRQGVVHQIKRLASDNVKVKADSSSSPKDSNSSDAVDSVKATAASIKGSTVQTTTASSKGSTSDKLPSGSPKVSDRSAGSSAVSGSSMAKIESIVKSKRTSKRALRGKTRSDQRDDSSCSAPATRAKTTYLRKDATTSSSPSSSGKHTSKSSLLAALHPSRWGGRSGSEGKASGLGMDRSISTAVLLASHREKVLTWIKTHSKEFMTEHFSQLSDSTMKAEGLLDTLSTAASQLSGLDRTDSVLKDSEALEVIAETICTEDVSPFEMIHSGVIEKLLSYVTSSTELTSASASSDYMLPLDKRLATFMNVVIGTPLEPSTKAVSSESIREDRLSQLVTIVMACLHQQEQFQVKVHDLGGGGGNSNSNALKFLNSHQLKCQLQRHPECKTFKAYEGGPVKVDPLAPVHAIENFLIRHGYCKTDASSAHSPVDPISDDDHDDSNSLDDLDDSMPAMLVDQSQGKHTIELVIADKTLSYNQTVLQAVRNHAAIDDVDTDHGLGGSSVWSQTHTIWYREASESATVSKTSASASKKSRQEGLTKLRKYRKNQDFYTERSGSARVSPLISSISTTISDKVSIKDTCVASLSLIRALYFINRFWGSFYKMPLYKPVVQDSVFVSSKLAAKANRQLQDPLVVMTGNIPLWLPQVASGCPFLFPFETRQMLFYVNSFDRDRAMMRLQDSGNEAVDTDTSGRVAPPRLEKKKKTVSRDKIVKQAEGIFEDVGKSKALLEIQYQNEVGTGLGPTLEFYSLISRELQAMDLDLWHGQALPVQLDDSSSKLYVDAKMGLYPKPLGKNVKPAVVSKVKAKFKLIGKLLAKALMDSRILDLPLNPIVYSWLLGQQHLLTCSDLALFDSTIAASYSQIKELADQAASIRASSSLSAEEQEKAVEELGIDNLCLDFTFPGYENIQLKRGGKDEQVTAENIDQYLELLCHWVFSEGIHRQMEALKEGFDSVFPSAQLADLFTADELEQLFCGNRCTQWDTKELFDCCRADHGYTMDSKTVGNLFEVLSSFDTVEQRKFLSFVTGSPRLPVGGFRSLNPPLTIVRKTFEASENPDDFLPSVMTCVNYLKLPDYSSVQVMRAKLDTATSIGQLSFHLS